MAVLQYKDPITGQMVDLPVASYGIKDAPKDGEQYVRQDGEWTSLSIEPSGPFVNQEYADIVVNAMNNNSISSDDYNKLFTWSAPIPENVVYPYAETLFAAVVARMTIARDVDSIYAYVHITQTGTNSPLNTFFYLVEIKEDLTVTIKEQRHLTLDTSGDGTRFLANDGSYKEIESSEPFVNAEYGKILKEANESQSITQDNYNLLLNAITSSSNGAMFCEYEYVYGRLYFMAINTGSGNITIYVNAQMAHVSEPSFMSGALTISSDLTVTSNMDSSIALSTSGDGTKYLADDGTYKEIHSYTTATTVASLDVNYESIYVTLTANASLSASATGAAYNGRTITAYVYTAAERTITIPTTGDYVSMCGSSFTTTAGGWVEFNLTCIDGKWHIAKLEQE